MQNKLQICKSVDISVVCVCDNPVVSYSRNLPRKTTLKGICPSCFHLGFYFNYSIWRSLSLARQLMWNSVCHRSHSHKIFRLCNADISRQPSPCRKSEYFCSQEIPRIFILLHPFIQSRHRIHLFHEIHLWNSLQSNPLWN